MYRGKLNIQWRDCRCPLLVQSRELSKSKRLSITRSVNASIRLQTANRRHLNPCGVQLLYPARAPNCSRRCYKRTEHVAVIVRRATMAAIGRNVVKSIFQWKTESKSHWRFLYILANFSILMNFISLLLRKVYWRRSLQTSDMRVRYVRKAARPMPTQRRQTLSGIFLSFNLKKWIYNIYFKSNWNLIFLRTHTRVNKISSKIYSI